MALTRTQINDIVAKMHGTRDLGSGGVLALKEVLYLLNDEITAINNAPVLLAVESTTLPGGYVVVAGGGLGVAVDSPNPGEYLITT